MTIHQIEAGSLWRGEAAREVRSDFYKKTGASDTKLAPTMRHQNSIDDAVSRLAPKTKSQPSKAVVIWKRRSKGAGG